MEILTGYKLLLERFEKYTKLCIYGSVYLCILADDLNEDGIITRDICESIKNEITAHLIEKTGTHASTMFDCLPIEEQSVTYPESIILANEYRRKFLNDKIAEHSALDNQ